MADVSSLSKSISEFSSHLYQNIIKENSGNIILSPLSVQIGLILAYGGAEGETAKVIASGIKLEGKSKDAVAKDFNALLSSLQNDETVKIVNSVYVMEGHKVEPAYQETVEKQYFSNISSLNFADSAASAKVINDWVESKTNSKIKDFISTDFLSYETRLVLVNAIYFRGLWKHKFSRERTKKVPFYTDATNNVMVDMMCMKEILQTSSIEELNADAIELPYENSEISMLIILPKERDGLTALEAALTTFDIASKIVSCAVL